MKTHKIRIYPNLKQEELLRQSCGVNRFVYNWALNKWNEIYKNEEKPNLNKIKLEFNKEKKNNKDLIWLYDVSKCIGEYAIMDLASAFKNFFNKKTRYPVFKKRKLGIGSFSIANDKFWVKGRNCRLPKIGIVTMAEQLRFEGKIMKGTVSWFADKWWLSVCVEVPVLKNNNKKVIGIDLGLKDQMITSDGNKYNLPDLSKERNRIRKEQKYLLRKQKGSKNKCKQIIKLQKTWLKYTDKKNDWIEKITTQIANEYQYVCLETLNIKGMLKNKKLSSKFQQVSLYKIVERLKTKTEVIQIDRFYPSSKTCSSCNHINNDLKLSDRYWKCDNCNTEHDRDINASINILNEGLKQIPEAIREFTLVDKKALAC